MKWLGGDFFEDESPETQSKIKETLVSSRAPAAPNCGGGTRTVSTQLHGFFFFAPGYTHGEVVGC